jgi:DNA replication protein DnaC
MASAMEVTARLMECLRELHLPTFRDGFEDLARHAVQESLSYEQYLGELADQECQVRRMNRIERWLRESDLPLDKSLPRFDMKRLPAIVSRQARTLLDGAFVETRENVLAFGRSGSGKTHLICGIAQELVRSGRRVLFGPCSLLVQDLLIAKRDLRLSRHLKKLAAFDVLVIDDLGYVEQSREEMEVLFTLLAERYERGSVMITSNLPFSKWESILEVGEHIQGSADNRGRDRPLGPSQRDPGVERAELPPRTGPTRPAVGPVRAATDRDPGTRNRASVSSAR